MTTEFFEKYCQKIKASGELRDIIGTFPRKRTAILCHGVFDLVHDPYNLRLLATHL